MTYMTRAIIPKKYVTVQDMNDTKLQQKNK